MEELLNDFKSIALNDLLNSSKKMYDNIIYFHCENSIKDTIQCYDNYIKQLNTPVSSSSIGFDDTKVNYLCVEQIFSTKRYPIYIKCDDSEVTITPFEVTELKYMIDNFIKNKTSYIRNWEMNVMRKFIDNTPHNRVCYMMVVPRYCIMCYLPVIKGDKDKHVFVNILIISLYGDGSLKKRISINFIHKYKPDEFIKGKTSFNGFCDYQKYANNKICKTCKQHIHSNGITCDKCHRVNYCNTYCEKKNSEVHDTFCKFIEKSHKKNHYMNRYCVNCEEFNINALLCKCNFVRYCNTDCQNNDWEHHKLVCKVKKKNKQLVGKNKQLVEKNKQLVGKNNHLVGKNNHLVGKNEQLKKETHEQLKKEKHGLLERVYVDIKKGHEQLKQIEQLKKEHEQLKKGHEQLKKKYELLLERKTRVEYFTVKNAKNIKEIKRRFNKEFNVIRSEKI